MDILGCGLLAALIFIYILQGSGIIITHLGSGSSLQLRRGVLIPIRSTLRQRRSFGVTWIERILLTGESKKRKLRRLASLFIQKCEDLGPLAHVNAGDSECFRNQNFHLNPNIDCV